LDQSETSSYQTTINSQISKSLTSIQLECQPVQRGRQKETRPENQSEERGGRDPNRVISGTTELVDRRKRTVDETMCATDARNEVTKGRTVGNLPLETSPRKRPRYLRSLIWSNPTRQPLISPTAYCTIFDKPLPRPPEDEYENLDAISTISRNPDLFKIITPINVSRFQQLLDSHPNKPFTDSVCLALREGFWPWAHTRLDAYPVTWDFSDRPPKTERKAGFLRSQRDTEIAEQRYSEGFGMSLFPGIAGEFSLNSMIARDDIIGARMDSFQPPRVTMGAVEI